MKKVLFLILFFIISFFFFSKPQKAGAKPMWNGEAYPDPCPTSCTTPDPGNCAKSEPGNCPSCGTSNSDCCGKALNWTKYDAECRLINPDDESCGWVWIPGPRICSTGDKCIGGEIGLRPGYCDCSYGGSLYKTCCQGATPVSCITGGGPLDDGIYPPEGSCGGAREVFCGFGSNPPCGAEACAMASPPGESPPPPGEPSCWDLGGGCCKGEHSCDNQLGGFGELGCDSGSRCCIGCRPPVPRSTEAWLETKIWRGGTGTPETYEVPEDGRENCVDDPLWINVFPDDELNFKMHIWAVEVDQSRCDGDQCRGGGDNVRGKLGFGREPDDFDDLDRPFYYQPIGPRGGSGHPNAALEVLYNSGSAGVEMKDKTDFWASSKMYSECDFTAYQKEDKNCWIHDVSECDQRYPDGFPGNGTGSECGRVSSKTRISECTLTYENGTVSYDSRDYFEISFQQAPFLIREEGTEDQFCVKGLAKVEGGKDEETQGICFKVIVPPRVVSVSPSGEWSGEPGSPDDGHHGDRNPQLFTTVFRHPKKYQDIHMGQLNIAKNMSGSEWYLRAMYAKDMHQHGWQGGSGKRFYFWDPSDPINYGFGEGVQLAGNCLREDIETDTAILRGGSTCANGSGTDLTVNFDVEFKDGFPEGNWGQYLYVEDKDGRQDTTTPELDIYDGWAYFHKLGEWGIDLTPPIVTTTCQTRGTAEEVDVTVYSDEDQSGGAPLRDFWHLWVHPEDKEGEIKVFKGNPLEGSFGNMTHKDYGDSETETSKTETLSGTWGRYLYWGVEDAAGNDNFKDFIGLVDNESDDYTQDRLQCGGPWWQVEGGDIHADAGQIQSIIPVPTCILPDCNPLLILDDAGAACGTDGCPGVAGANTGTVDLGMTGWREYLSTEQWLTTTGQVTVPAYKKADYDFYWKKLEPETDWIIFVGPIMMSGIYKVDYSSWQTGEPELNFTSDVKVIVLTQGDVVVDSEITVEPGSLFVLISKKKITFAEDVEKSQGVFIADQIVFASQESGEPSDVKFEGEGTFVGWSGVDLSGRDFNDERNNTEPVISFKFRPDFVINAPDELKTALYPRWEEVIPQFGQVTPTPVSPPPSLPPTPTAPPSPTPPPCPAGDKCGCPACQEGDGMGGCRDVPNGSDRFAECGGSSCCGYCENGSCKNRSSGSTCSSPGTSCSGYSRCNGSGSCTTSKTRGIEACCPFPSGFSCDDCNSCSSLTCDEVCAAAGYDGCEYTESRRTACEHAGSGSLVGCSSSLKRKCEGLCPYSWSDYFFCYCFNYVY